MTNKEREQAAKDHGGVVHKVARSFWRTHKHIAELDDFVGEAYVGMAHALNKFEEGKGRTICAFIHLCVVSHLSTFITDMTRGKRFDPDITIVSMDKCTDDVSLHDIIADTSSVEMDVLDKVEYDYISAQLSEKEVELLEWIIAGLPLSDYAIMLGKGKHTICHYRDDLRKKIEFLIDNFV